MRVRRPGGSARSARPDVTGLASCSVTPRVCVTTNRGASGFCVQCDGTLDCVVSSRCDTSGHGRSRARRGRCAKPRGTSTDPTALRPGAAARCGRRARGARRSRSRFHPRTRRAVVRGHRAIEGRGWDDRLGTTSTRRIMTWRDGGAAWCGGEARRGGPEARPPQAGGSAAVDVIAPFDRSIDRVGVLARRQLDHVCFGRSTTCASADRPRMFRQIDHVPAAAW